jgi:hypothetical protein
VTHPTRPARSRTAPIARPGRGSRGETTVSRPPREPTSAHMAGISFRSPRQAHVGRERRPRRDAAGLQNGLGRKLSDSWGGAQAARARDTSDWARVKRYVNVGIRRRPSVPSPSRASRLGTSSRRQTAASCSGALRRRKRCSATSSSRQSSAGRIVDLLEPLRGVGAQPHGRSRRTKMLNRPRGVGGGEAAAHLARNDAERSALTNGDGLPAKASLATSGGSSTARGVTGPAPWRWRRILPPPGCREARLRPPPAWQAMPRRAQPRPSSPRAPSRG